MSLDSGSAATPDRWKIAGLVAVGVTALFSLLFAAFPWGMFADRAASPLSALIGRKVTVGSAHRVDFFSFSPTVDLRDVRIAQPAWAGRDDFGQIAHLRVRFRVLPLLAGRFEPTSIIADGLVLRLHRYADGRENWLDPKRRHQSLTSPALRFVTIRNSRIELRNDTRQVLLVTSLAVDPQHGLSIAGSGIHRGQPVRIAVRAPPIVEASAGRPYPVALSLHSPILSVEAVGRLDQPLDFEHYEARITTSGRNLTYLDDIIQAGLFDTQPFRLTADIRHDAPDWTIRTLSGSIGRSRLSAAGTVKLVRGRTRVVAQVVADQLDFDDLASDEQHAETKSRTARLGVRILPHTRILLDRIARLDGTLHARVHRLLDDKRSPFRTLDATLVLDHRLLRVAPLKVGLTHGRIIGTMILDDRDDRHKLVVNVRMTGSHIADLVGPTDAIEAPIDGQIDVIGKGGYFDEAMARADGHMGFVARGGTVRKDVALYASGDAIKTIAAAIGKPKGPVPMRCLIGDFLVRSGTVTPSLLAFTTDKSRVDGTGSVRLSDERIDLSFTGRSDHPGLLQSTAPLRLGGTLASAHVETRSPEAAGPGDKATGKLGQFLKGLKTRGDRGRSIPAAPLDCISARNKALAG
jgi:uncharacterized protein involved in outer membrane biogenesis